MINVYNIAVHVNEKEPHPDKLQQKKQVVWIEHVVGDSYLSFVSVLSSRQKVIDLWKKEEHLSDSELQSRVEGQESDTMVFKSPAGFDLRCAIQAEIDA